jgi:hypothetical protein
VLSSVNAQGDTARYALVPFLADRARMPIERANGADRAIVRLGQVVGPILGGILIAAIGAANVLFVDAASFAVSAIAVAIGVPAAANRAESAQAQGGRSYLAELREGLRFIPGPHRAAVDDPDRHRGQLPRQAAGHRHPARVCQDLLWQPDQPRAGPGGLRRRGPDRLPAVRGRRARLAAAADPARLLGAGTAGDLRDLGPHPAAWGPGGRGICRRAAVRPHQPDRLHGIQEHTPPQLLGRVFGALTALAQAGIPIGAVLAGVVVQRAGLVPTIVGMGVLYLLVPLGMFFNRALRQMDTGRRGESPSPAPAVE